VAQNGDRVAVHYKGTLDDGSLFDSSEGRDPLQFTVGGGQVIPGFDAAVRDLEPGQSKTVRLEAEQAYGPRQDELVIEVPLDGAPEGLVVGDRVELMNGAPAKVIAMTQGTVTVDANHPLSGQALTFEITLVSVA
jgi:peptidylprolyl isomerase